MIYSAIQQSFLCSFFAKLLDLLCTQKPLSRCNCSVGKTWHQLGIGFHRPLMMTDRFISNEL